MATVTRAPDFSYIPRALDLAALLDRKSVFLFGPRQTGKTSLIRHTLPNARVYDLLDTGLFLALSREPGRIAQELNDRDRVVVIDEIQSLPILLNEVQRLIEEKGIRFLLTGSSARKLRCGGVNLLGGRARTRHLHPLTYRELGLQFQLSRALACGLIPSLYFSDDPKADLQAYTDSYIRQEIVSEGVTRNLSAFSRFLTAAACCNATIVHFTKIAADAQVPRTTVYEYFEILKDTLLIHELPAWRMSLKRKPLASSKFYFFDVGIAAQLQGRLFQPGTPEMGEAFETYLMHELRTFVDTVSAEPLSYWRSTSGFEVDFILGDHTAIEVKARPNLTARELKGLHALAEEKKLKRYLIVSLEERPRSDGTVTMLPYRMFLEALWSGEYN